MIHYVQAQHFPLFSINTNSGVAIYRQVVEQVVSLVDRGQIEFGDMLPSVRQLALELGINPMTVSRAYSQLEIDGVVERKRGVGMVVIRKASRPNDLLLPAISSLIADAKEIGMTESQLFALIRKNWKSRRRKKVDP